MCMEKKFFKWLLNDYWHRFTKGIWKDMWEYVKEETLYASKPSQTYEAAKIFFIIFLVLVLAQKLPWWVAVISFGYLIYADIRKKYISGDFRRGEHEGETENSSN
jgi:hypothetical protein